jgi:hypothetical protein
MRFWLSSLLILAHALAAALGLNPPCPSVENSTTTIPTKATSSKTVTAIVVAEGDILCGLLVWEVVGRKVVCCGCGCMVDWVSWYVGSME